MNIKKFNEMKKEEIDYSKMSNDELNSLANTKSVSMN